MKKKTYLLYLCTCALGCLATSCDDHADDPKYRSLPPRFSDMEFKMLSDGSTTVRAGEKCVATCVQSKRGRLLNYTTYDWTAHNDDVSHGFKKELKAGYDNEYQNPTDTIVFPKAGRYNLTFKARYTTSGNYEVISEKVAIDKGSITYKSPSFQFYDVIIEKGVIVK